MKLSVQSQNLVDHFGYDKAYKMMKEAGFEATDWNIDHALVHKDVVAAEKLEGLSIFEKSMDEIMAYYSEELEYMKKYGITITQAHSPFPPDQPGRPEVLPYTIGIYQQMIRFCQKVGCPRLIIHGISKREPYPEIKQEEVDQLNDTMYTSLIPVLQECPDVMVCMENLFTHPTQLGAGFWAGHCSNPYEAAAYIDKMNALAGRKAFGLCLDTGHLNLCRIPFCKYIPVLGDRIAALHIHDNMQNDDAHLMPYTGNIHWEEFCEEMHKIGYAGDLSFETFAQTNLQRLPAQLCPQFLSTIHAIGTYFQSQIKK